MWEGKIMIYNMVKKDFILVKKYLALILVFAILGPIFIINQEGLVGGTFISFFITAWFIQYMLFNAISMYEDKYKGSLHLCTTPYTRRSLVRGKYMFVIITFIMSTLIYVGVASLEGVKIPFINMAINLPMITVKDLGISCLIISTLLGIFIPLQYKFGYEKTKYIAWIVTFLSPILLPLILKILASNNIDLQMNSIYLDIVLFLLAFIFGILSMYISTYIYSKKDL